MRRIWLAVLVALGMGVLSAWAQVDHAIVGKWKTIGDFEPIEYFDEVGWEIEFRANGRFKLLSDQGMGIQNWRTGKFRVSEGRLSMDYFRDGEPLEFEFRLHSEGSELFVGNETWNLHLVRSDEPHLELRALPRMPRNVREATELLISEMSERDKRYVASRKRDDLISFHMGWGMGIRNRFGLWSGNKRLLASCGSPWMHPDSASGVIIESVWKTLRKDFDAEYLAELKKVHKACDEVTIPAVRLSEADLAGLAGAINEALAAAYPELGEGNRIRFVVRGEAGWLKRGLDLKFEENEVLSISELLGPLSFRHFARVEYAPGKVVLVGPKFDEAPNETQGCRRIP